MSFCECSGAHRPWCLQYPPGENAFFRIRPHAFWVAFWMGIGVVFCDMLEMFSLQNRSKKTFYFWVCFLLNCWWILGGLGRLWVAKNASKNDAKHNSEKTWKKGMQVYAGHIRFSHWGEGVPYKIPAGSGPRDKEWKQCSKRPDKTLWPLHFVPRGHGGGSFP